MRERNNADDDTMQMPPTPYIPYVLSLATVSTRRDSLYAFRIQCEILSRRLSYILKHYIYIFFLLLSFVRQIKIVLKFKRKKKTFFS